MEANFTRGIGLKKFLSRTMNYTFDYIILTYTHSTHIYTYVHNIRAHFLQKREKKIKKKNKLFYNERKQYNNKQGNVYRKRDEKTKAKEFSVIFHILF